MPNLNELNKLEAILKERGIKYDRTDEENPFYNRHQIVVRDDDGNWLWDAICHLGSYGYADGLLEVMGEPVVNPEYDGDDVAGYLTAQDVIDRLDGKFNYEEGDDES